MAHFQDFTVPNLKAFIFDRIQQCPNFKKMELIKIAEALNELRIGIQPNENEKRNISEKRLAEILYISETDCRLNHPSEINSDKWSNSFCDVPTVTFGDIYSYFILAPSPVYNMQKLKAYKSLDAFSNTENGFIGDVRVCRPVKGYCYIKGTVRASQTIDKFYYPWILLDEHKNEIKGARCTCKAGEGEACTHVASVLFYCMRISDVGLNVQAPTDRLCAWKPPTFKEHIDPALICHSAPPPQLFNVNVEINDTKKLERLQIMCPNSRIAFLHYPPICNIVPLADSFLEVSTSVENNLHKLCVSNIIRQFVNETEFNLEAVFNAVQLSVMEEESELVCVETVGQAQNPLWLKLREGRITASKAAHSIRTFYNDKGGFWKNKHPNSAISSILSSSSSSSSTNSFHSHAMNYGTENEENAATEYLNKFSQHHTNLKLTKVGLKILPKSAHLACSIDRLVSCDCCPNKRLLEIKCPFSAFNKPNTLFTLPYLRKEENDGHYQLCRSHQYFTQIQFQLYIFQLLEADLFIWCNTNESLVLKVIYDKKFCLDLHSKCDRFYLSYILPGLLQKYSYV